VSAGRDGCERVNVSSSTGLPGQKAIKPLCVCVCVCVLETWRFSIPNIIDSGPYFVAV